MRKIILKCFFPYNYYTARKIKITSSNGANYNLAHSQSIDIESFNEKWLDFKLDYHKYRLTLENNSSEENLYVIVTLKCRNLFPYKFTDVMFKNAMKAEVVDKETFDNFEYSFNNLNYKRKEYSLIDYFAVGLYVLLFLGYIVLSILNENLIERNFLFLIGVAGFISALRLVFNRKKVSSNNFDFSIQLSSLISLVLLVFINFSIIVKVIFASISMTQYLITAHNKGCS